MRILLALLLLLSYCSDAQEYRIVYDSSSIPELYHRTDLSLQEKAGNGWAPAHRKYRLRSADAEITGRSLFYTDNVLKRDNGRIHIMASIDGQEVPLSLQLPVLKDIRYHLYTDSIKPILNYYVNVEGIYSSGRIYPFSETDVTITPNIGVMRGMAWEAPDKSFDKVTFTATAIQNVSITQSVTLYRQRRIDPRDAPGYEEPDH